jgi:dienelactone hydrolase
MKRLFIIRNFFMLALICFASAALEAQQTAQKFVRETNYYLSLPQDYGKDTAMRWPLLMFLHGSGESGTDIQKVKVHGPPELADKGKQFPFIIVSPQADAPVGWDIEMLYQLLQQIKKSYRVNESKIYLTGLSMGGFGTWELAMKHPDEFAAIAPVCGGGDTADVWKLRHIPVWCFHGAKDDVVLPVNSENLVKATKRYNPNVRFTLYPEANHNSWDLTYNNDSLYTWLLAQTKFTYTEKNITVAQLKKYEGYYTSGTDSVQIIAGSNGLSGKHGNENIPLKAASETVFFIQPDRNMELRFITDKGKTTGFWFWGGEKMWFRKVQRK